MKIDKLVQACERFEKLAQKIVLDPKKSNVDFYSKFLYNAIASYSQLLPSLQAAQVVYDTLANKNKTLGYNNSSPELRQVTQIEAAINEASSRLQAAGLNPIDVLKKKMQNVHPSILSVLLSNLKVLANAREGVRLSDASSGYKHYSLPRAGELQYIDLDHEVSSKETGY